MGSREEGSVGAVAALVSYSSLCCDGAGAERGRGGAGALWALQRLSHCSSLFFVYVKRWKFVQWFKQHTWLCLNNSWISGTIQDLGFFVLHKVSTQSCLPLRPKSPCSASIGEGYSN